MEEIYEKPSESRAALVRWGKDGVNEKLPNSIRAKVLNEEHHPDVVAAFAERADITINEIEKLHDINSLELYSSICYNSQSKYSEKNNRKSCSECSHKDSEEILPASILKEGVSREDENGNCKEHSHEQYFRKAGKSSG